MDYLDNVVYSYAMDSYIHNNSNRFIFRDIDNEFFKTESGGFLKINVTGECFLIYEDMFNGTGKLNINTTDDPDAYVDTYSIDMSYSKLTTQKIKHDFSINKPTYLSIASEGSLILDGQRADVQKFRLYVISDMTYISYSDNRYLKLDGSNPMKGNLDAGGKNILRVENLTDYKDTDPYDYRVKDVKSVVNKEYLNENFMKKVDKGGKEYYDTKGRKITSSEPYNEFDKPNDLVSKAFVQTEIAKLPKPATDLLKLDGSKAMIGNLDMGDHTITGIRSSAADNAALTVGGAKATYLPLLGDRSMQGNLNMGGHAIINIKPFVEDDSSQAASDAQRNEVINFGYFKDERADITRIETSR